MNSRRLLLLLLALSLAGLHAQTPAVPPSTAPAAAVAQAEPEPPLQWHDVTKWGVEGRAWTDMEREGWFDRLPKAANGKVTEKVWSLSRNSAGLMVRFKTDSTAIWANYMLRSDKLGLTNMTPMGASGIDLYARDEQGTWRWAGCTKPDKKQVRQAIVSGLAPGLREYAAYLPLFNGVESLELGALGQAKFEELPPRTEKPIVFYGTSITHGASASRPGMVHTAILGRRLEKPVINLGFSGNGKMDARGRRVHGEDGRGGLRHRLPAEHGAGRGPAEVPAARASSSAPRVRRRRSCSWRIAATRTPGFSRRATNCTRRTTPPCARASRR